MQVIAVALPPGRAMLAITWSGLSHTIATIGIVPVASFQRVILVRPRRPSRLRWPQQARAQAPGRDRHSLAMIWGRLDILALYVSQVAQSLPKRHIVCGRQRCICEHADARK